MSDPRWARLVLVGFLASIVLATIPPAPATAAAAWEIYDLGLPFAADSTQANAIDDAGTVAATASIDIWSRPVRWTYQSVADLTAAALTTVNGTQLVPDYVIDMNNNGAILGGYSPFCSGTSCPSGAFLLNPDGTVAFIDVRVLDQPAAVNDLGQVAGISAGHAAIWQNGSVLVEDPSLGSWAADLNDAGQVVGQGANADAYLWQNGAPTDLGNLPGGAAVPPTASTQPARSSDMPTSRTRGASATGSTTRRSGRTAR